MTITQRAASSCHFEAVLLASSTLLRKSLKTDTEPAFSAFLPDVLPLVLNPEPSTLDLNGAAEI
ncbi:MAG: hypothetical protein JRN26_04025 [Nitrososphaerota archaeon]|nr:hypothetical protein [Nitrososphaerota archaeon]